MRLRAFRQPLPWRPAAWGLMMLVAQASEARADHCDPPQVTPRTSGRGEAGGLVFSTGASALRIDHDAWRGLAVGAHLGLTATAGAWRVASWLPAWRLEADTALATATTAPGDVSGLGDAGLQVARTWEVGGDLALGGALTVTAPTGAAEDSLGMGHWMVSPALWAAVTTGPLALEASAVYSEAVGAAAHAHHATTSPGRSPLVSPMNAREVGGGLALILAATSDLRLQAEVRGATPVGGVDGIARAIAGLQAAWSLGPGLTLQGGLEAGLVGAPFAVRGSLGLAARLAAW